MNKTRWNAVPEYDQPSLSSKALIESAERYFVPNYKPKHVLLDHGKGARVWDKDGNEYIDLGTGISVTGLGHGDPELVQTLTAQARKLWHGSNLYYNEEPIRLAEELVESATFAARAFFCNSGAEANEAAIKLARKHSSLSHGPEKREIISFVGGFHGRTLATVTATAQPKYHEGFEPLPGGFKYSEFNDFDAVAELVSDNTCAIIVEPIQGEGGINPAAPGFLTHLRTLCDNVDALLICDEVQTGVGRTGRLFTHQWEPDLEPDIVTMAKALGGGLPIGALLTGPKAAEALQPGSHGTTFGGNPIASAVARVVWRRVQQPDLLENVERQGTVLVERLHAIGERLDLFTEVRGRGLMVGAGLKGDWATRAGELSDACQRHGVLVLTAGSNDTLRFLPPLCITDEELTVGLDRFEASLEEAVQGT